MGGPHVETRLASPASLQAPTTQDILPSTSPFKPDSRSDPPNLPRGRQHPPPARVREKPARPGWMLEARSNRAPPGAPQTQADPPNQPTASPRSHLHAVGGPTPPPHTRDPQQHPAAGGGAKQSPPTHHYHHGRRAARSVTSLPARRRETRKSAAPGLRCGAPARRPCDVTSGAPPRKPGRARLPA